MLENDSITPNSAHYALARHETVEPAESQRIEGIGFYGILSSSFRTSIFHAYKQLPEQLRFFIRDGGGRIAVGDYMTRIWPHRANIVFSPTIDDARTHANHWRGYYVGKTREIAVTRFYLDESRDGTACRSPWKNPGTIWRPNDKPQGVLRHEIGHRLDGDLFMISNSPSFLDCWMNDIESLGGETSARNKNLGYFVQNGFKGRMEVFAELWAHEHGGGVNSQSAIAAHRHFTLCYDWTKEFIDHFYIALAAGEKAIARLAKDYQNEPDICVTKRLTKPHGLHLS